MLYDDSPMPYGKYKGHMMENVPAEYLLRLYRKNKCDGPLKDYIEDNLDVLRMEVEKQEKDILYRIMYRY